jgi:hypothetical protein
VTSGGSQRALERERFVMPAVELKDDKTGNVEETFPASFDSTV